MDWFRFYTDTVSDRKLRRLPPAQRWLWVAVLTVARQSAEPGRLLLSEQSDSNVTETLHVTGSETPMSVAVTNEDLADIAKIDIEDVDAGISAFMMQKMLHIEKGVYVVTHWKKRQYISDSSTERVRKHRAKQQEDNNNETLQGRSMKRYTTVTETPPDTDTDTDTDTDLKRSINTTTETVDEFTELVRMYEREGFGVLSKIVQDRLEYAYTTYSYVWVVQAMTEAVRYNKKSLAYVEKVLANWRAEGGPDAAKAKKEAAAANGNGKHFQGRDNSATKKDGRYDKFYELYPDG